jgi:hypothetical protein
MLVLPRDNRVVPPTAALGEAIEIFGIDIAAQFPVALFGSKLQKRFPEARNGEDRESGFCKGDNGSASNSRTRFRHTLYCMRLDRSRRC